MSLTTESNNYPRQTNVLYLYTYSVDRSLITQRIGKFKSRYELSESTDSCLFTPRTCYICVALYLEKLSKFICFRKIEENYKAKNVGVHFQFIPNLARINYLKGSLSTTRKPSRTLITLALRSSLRKEKRLRSWPKDTVFTCTEDACAYKSYSS